MLGVLKKEGGAVTLLMAVILLTLSTLIILFTANMGMMQEKTTANTNRNNQAFAAAEAGLEYAINHLQVNSETILANPSGGYILPYTSSKTTNVTLANNSQFSVTYTNPIANTYTLILITSTGTSDDGSSTRVISQLVRFGTMMLKMPAVPMITKGTVSLSGSSTVTNTGGTNTIQAGKTVTLSGSSQTVNSGGVASTPGNILSDIQQNVSGLNNQSQSDFFASYFGLPMSTIKSTAAHYYSNSTSTNYSATLNGMAGTSIWIDQTGGAATLNGTVTIGSSTNPVVLVLNGDLTLTGTVTIYGLVFVIGTTTTDVLGNVTVQGSLVSTSDLTLKGTTQVMYNPAVLSTLQNLPTLRYYAKIPGSWTDF